ncbi:hypothetical protein COO60DRAFT_4123 [Scenedesmus sp. NREL 46B-D3]|nr:hypothetical protein COO60DRAFT_4123 [Scenedesmus sp. NREL 46B-D3]
MRTDPSVVPQGMLPGPRRLRLLAPLFRLAVLVVLLLACPLACALRRCALHPACYTVLASPPLCLPLPACLPACLPAGVCHTLAGWQPLSGRPGR